MRLGSLLSATGKIFAGGALSTRSCLRGGSLLSVLGPVDLASSVLVRDDMNLGTKLSVRVSGCIGEQFTVEGTSNLQQSARLNNDLIVEGMLSSI